LAPALVSCGRGLKGMGLQLLQTRSVTSFSRTRDLPRTQSGKQGKAWPWRAATKGSGKQEAASGLRRDKTSASKLQEARVSSLLSPQPRSARLPLQCATWLTTWLGNVGVRSLVRGKQLVTRPCPTTASVPHGRLPHSSGCLFGPCASRHLDDGNRRGGHLLFSSSPRR